MGDRRNLEIEAFKESLRAKLDEAISSLRSRIGESNRLLSSYREVVERATDTWRANVITSKKATLQEYLGRKEQELEEAKERHLRQINEWREWKYSQILDYQTWKSTQMKVDVLPELDVANSILAKAVKIVRGEISIAEDKVVSTEEAAGKPVMDSTDLEISRELNDFGKSRGLKSEKDGADMNQEFDTKFEEWKKKRGRG